MTSWEKVSYSLVDEQTIEVRLWLESGTHDLTFVLAEAFPALVPQVVETSLGSRLSLTFDTAAGRAYRVQRAWQVGDPSWFDIPYAGKPDSVATQETVVGTDAEATVHVDVPASGRPVFFRLRVERAVP